MKYLGYLFLLMFWGGVLLLADNKRLGLREYGKSISSLFRQSVIYEKWVLIGKSMQRQALMQELSEGLAYIKNLAILGRAKSISSMTLLDELSSFSPRLKKSYIAMASFLAINEKEKAAKVLESSIAGTFAKDIARLLSCWEDIPPKEMLGSIDAYSKAIRAERLTYLKRKDELVSDLVYFPVVLNCMLVLLNFVFVAYFIEQKQTLMILFGN